MNIKWCLLKLTLTFITPCLNIEKVILARSGAHMIDDIAFKYETNLPRC